MQASVGRSASCRCHRNRHRLTPIVGGLSLGTACGGERVSQDGHTFLLAGNTLRMQVPLRKKNPPSDPVKRFNPVARVGRYVYGQFTLAKPAGTLPRFKDGKLRALAVLLPARSQLLPQVPTAAEAGVPPLTAGTWAAMQRPDVRERISALGFELAGATPDEIAQFLGEQLVAWGRAFRDAGMTPE